MNNNYAMSFYLGKLSHCLGRDDMFVYLEEYFDNKDILENIESKVKDVDAFRKKEWNQTSELGIYRAMLYMLLRAVKPKNVIETGVLHGITTSVMLDAIKRNNTGKLHSIDLPSYFDVGPSNKDGYNDTLPEALQPGWMVAENTKEYWNLNLGSSEDMLKPLLEELKELDIFIHDSDHTYQNMWFELTTAWPYVKDGGIVVCDNIDANSSFYDFCRTVDRTPIILPELVGSNGRIRIGVVKK